MNGAEVLLRTAAKAGVDVCFVNPGTTELPIVAALEAVALRAVLALAEGVVAGAADGYGRLAGRPALTLTHQGPSFANALANLHNARRARSPVVNVVGDQPTWHRPFDPPLTTDVLALAKTVSGFARATRGAADVGRDLADAIAAASGPPGDVATLVVPADAQWGEGGAVGEPRARRALP
ncbi:MAG TPA: thiamine pyrophosphate-binding protein, partial [Minicystis sp.]|nr:thiamine pyrophosphate-binding protein [Minicystis sp.]